MQQGGQDDDQAPFAASPAVEIGIVADRDDALPTVGDGRTPSWRWMTFIVAAMRSAARGVHARVDTEVASRSPRRGSRSCN